MVLSYTDDFQVTWADAEDGKGTWMYDPMHFPEPVPPLTGYIFERMIS